MITQPFKLTDEAFLIPSHWRSPGAPIGVNLSAAVLRSEQPVLFDTGVAADRDAWLGAVGSIVDLNDVRWVVLTHDDPDHTGNLPAALELCPNATVVSTWFMSERMGPELPIDPRRLRWVGHGEQLDIGDRVLQFLRPPLYDSPTTRVVFDPSSRLLWAADLFALPTPEPVDDVRLIDEALLEEGFLQFQRWNSPWFEMLDHGRYRQAVADLAALDPAVIASTHGPAWPQGSTQRAFELLDAVIDGPLPPEPGQGVLDEVVAQIVAAASATPA